VSIWITSVVNPIEKKSLLALMVFIVSLVSWILYGKKVYRTEITVPEIISFVAIVSLLQLSTIKIYFGKNDLTLARAKNLNEVIDFLSKIR